MAREATRQNYVLQTRVWVAVMLGLMLCVFGAHYLYYVTDNPVYVLTQYVFLFAEGGALVEVWKSANKAREYR